MYSYIILVKIKAMGSERSIWTNEDKLLNALMSPSLLFCSTLKFALVGFISL